MGCQLETKFWNKKILDWERKRYFSKSLGGRALRKRMEFAKKVCEEFKFEKVLELGCGSGVFYSMIFRSVDRYVGVDLSDTAIAAFRDKNILKNGKLVCSNLEKFGNGRQSQTNDLVISLGTIDWLNRDELKAFKNINNGQFFLHSFSQKKSILRSLHFILTFVAYGRKNTSYMAKYYSNKEVSVLLGKKLSDLKFIKITSLVYFVTNMDLKEL